MIVVEQLGLLFIHVPQTGGTAVRRYLREEFGGVGAGPYHGHDQRHLAPEWRGRPLITVATIRDPLDLTVSSFFKQETDHEGWYLSGGLGDRRVAQATYAQRPDVDFDDWFLRYRNRVFAPSWLHAARTAEHLLRFESLEADLTTMLRELGVADPPSLPVRNATRRPADGADFFADPAAARRAHRVFSPFMQEFGYEFPDGWPTTVPIASRLEYEVGHRARRRVVPPGD